MPSAIEPDGQAFAMAGEDLLVEIGALAYDGGIGKDATNFGKETGFGTPRTPQLRRAPEFRTPGGSAGDAGAGG